uniref:C-type lectin domain-containing protein n=1 Tax=Bursaphelenchus xylophilus TaxID=6326 RepID=A0A1I7SE07_BURXY
MRGRNRRFPKGSRRSACTVRCDKRPKKVYALSGTTSTNKSPLKPQFQGMSISCQHGEKECEINTFFSCAQQHVNPPFDFVYCIERELKNFSTFEVAKTRCYRERNVPVATQSRLQSCTYGNEGRQLQLQAARITEAEFPELHLTVPYTIINNVSLVSAQHMRSNLGLMICDWYVGRNFVPPPCKELS